MDDFPNFNNTQPDTFQPADTTEGSLNDSVAQTQTQPDGQPPAVPMPAAGYQAPVYTPPVQNPVQPPMQPPVQPPMPAYGQPMQPPYAPPAAPQYGQPPYQAPGAAPNYNYYQQQQPGYMPPMYPPAVTPHRSGDGFGVASLIIGIASIVFFMVPFFDVILAVLGLIFGIIARKRTRTGLALAGIIISAISLGLGLVYSIAMIAVIANGFNTGDFASEFNYDSDWYNEMKLFVHHFLHR